MKKDGVIIDISVDQSMVITVQMKLYLNNAVWFGRGERI